MLGIDAFIPVFSETESVNTEFTSSTELSMVSEELVTIRCADHNLIDTIEFIPVFYAAESVNTRFT